LARLSGGKNETAKAKRDLFDYTESLLAKALKTGSGSDKKVKALSKLANAHLEMI
jgi:hypothetical protein